MLENNPFDFNILSLVVWFPALGALFIMLFMKSSQGNAIKWAANIITFIGFLICFYSMCVGWLAAVLDGPGRPAV